MERARVRELHNIAHFENVPSILNHGILCHRPRRACSIIQSPTRMCRHGEQRRVPGGLPLHRYACLRGPRRKRCCTGCSARHR